MSLQKAKTAEPQIPQRSDGSELLGKGDAFWRLLSFFRPYWKRVAACILLIGVAEGLRFYFILANPTLTPPAN